MKKGEIYEGIIEKVEFPNKGYVMVDDQKVLIKNGIPGTESTFHDPEETFRQSAGTDYGNSGEVASRRQENRYAVISPHVEAACTRLCLTRTSLSMKENQIRELLEEALIQGGQTDAEGKADFVWEGIHRSPEEFGYRNKMEFSFGDEYKDGPLSLGLHKKGSTYDILNTDDCKLVHRGYDRHSGMCKRFFQGKGSFLLQKAAACRISETSDGPERRYDLARSWYTL